MKPFWRDTRWLYPGARGVWTSVWVALLLCVGTVLSSCSPTTEGGAAMAEGGADAFEASAADSDGAPDAVPEAGPATAKLLVSNDPQLITQVDAKGTQLTATAVLNNGQLLDVTKQANWVTSNAAVATVVAGLVQPVSQGTCIITVSYGGQTTQRSVLVQASTLTVQSLVLAPNPLELAPKLSKRLKAVAILSDGTERDVTAQASHWSSSDGTVAQVSSDGTVTAEAPGSATITCDFSFGGVTKQGRAQVNVLSETLQSIEIFPSSRSVAIGFNVSFVARGTFATGQRDITASVSFVAEPAGYLVFGTGPSGATATAVQSGSVQVKGVVGQLESAPISITISPGAVALSQLRIDGSAQPLALQYGQQTSVQLRAYAVYSDGMVDDVTSSASWAVNPSDIVDIIPFGPTGGTVTAKLTGDAIASASYQGLRAERVITVGAPQLQIDHGPEFVTAVSPPSVAPRTTALALRAYYNDGTSRDVTQLAEWWSDAPSIATVCCGTGNLGTGLLTPVSTTTSTPILVHARYGGGTADLRVYVTSASVTLDGNVPLGVSLPQNSSPLALGEGMGAPLRAVATFTDGSAHDVTAESVFTVPGASPCYVVSPPSATVPTVYGSPGGGGGSCTITGRFTLAGGSVSGSITVPIIALSSLALAGNTPIVPRGLSVVFTAQGVFASPIGTVDLTHSVSYSALSGLGGGAVAFLGSPLANVATGIGEGTVIVRASFAGKVASTELTVTPPALIRLLVEPVPYAWSADRPCVHASGPSASSLPRGIRCNWHAIGYFSDSPDAGINITPNVIWQTTDTNILQWGTAGDGGVLLQARDAGSAIVSATFGSAVAQRFLSVNTDVLTGQLIIEPTTTSTLAVGQTRQYNVYGLFSNGSIFDLTQTVAWDAVVRANNELVSSIPAYVIRSTPGTYSAVNSTVAANTQWSDASTEYEDCTMVQASYNGDAQVSHSPLCIVP